MKASKQIRQLLVARATQFQSPYLANDVFDELQHFDVELVLNQLEWAFTHPNRLVAILALDVAPQFRTKANRLIPALSRLLSHQDICIRGGALTALGLRRKAAAHTIPMIEQLLDSETELERLIVAEALWMISGHTHAQAKAVLQKIETTRCLASLAKAALSDDALELY